MLPPLLPQPYARRIAVGERNARLFAHALDRREVVAAGHAAALFRNR